MRSPGLSHEARRHHCHRLFLSSVACEMAAPDRPANTSAVKAAALSEPMGPGAEAHEVPTLAVGWWWLDGMEASSQAPRRAQAKTVAVMKGLATSPLVARSMTGHPGPALSAAGCLRGAAVSASRRRAATSRMQGGVVGGRLAVKCNAAAQRGQASSRSPVSHPLPTGVANCRGSRAEMADRFTFVVAIRGPKAEGSVWGRSPRPQADRRGQVGPGRRSTAQSPNASSGRGGDTCPRLE